MHSLCTWSGLWSRFERLREGASEGGGDRWVPVSRAEVSSDLADKSRPVSGTQSCQPQLSACLCSRYLPFILSCEEKFLIFSTTELLVFRIWSWWKFVADPGACPRLRHPCRCQRTDWSRWSEGLPGREVCRSHLLPHGLRLRRVHHPLLQEGWRLQEAQLRCAGHVHWLCLLPQGLREGIQVSCDAYDGNQKFKNCLQNRWHTRVYHLATEVAKGWVSDKWRTKHSWLHFYTLTGCFLLFKCWIS